MLYIEAMRAQARLRHRLACIAVAIFVAVALGPLTPAACAEEKKGTWQEIKQSIKGAAKEIKKGIKGAAKEVKGAAKEVKSETKKAVDSDDKPKPTKEAAKKAYRGELTRKDIMVIQDSLNKLGYNAGPADGVVGSQTTSAVARFQKSKNLTPDGKVTHTLMEQLNTAVTVKLNPSKAHE